jgi:hypothetical protein
MSVGQLAFDEMRRIITMSLLVPQRQEVPLSGDAEVRVGPPVSH